MIPSGYILYEGPSVLTGDPIFMIAITKSSNRKTGNLIQTYIMRSDVDPISASKSGADVAVCGNCIHRGEANGEHAKGRTCYVNLGQGPRAVFDAYTRGRYPPIESYDIFNGRKTRLGTYGDPACIPYEIIEKICHNSLQWTAYTHTWRYCDPRFAQICMASVDTLSEYHEARELNYRPFRVSSDGDTLIEGEIRCPAGADEGHRLTCEQCMACSGTRFGTFGPRAAGIVIKTHGRTWVPAVLTKNLQAFHARKGALPHG